MTELKKIFNITRGPGKQGDRPPPLFMFYVYVLKSQKDGRLYIGVTQNLRQRLKKHNQRSNLSTKRRGPFVLVYYEAYRAKKDALIREKKLKKFKNSYKHLKNRIKYSLHES